MKMQSHRNKAHYIEDVLRKIYSPLANEFVDANLAYVKADTEILSPKDAANPMRNVLTHLEGNLVEMARVHPGENIPNGDSWGFIANRLATGGKGSSEHTLLSIKAYDQKNISVELTAITKNTAINPLLRLRMVYVQWLEHLNNTLKLINLTNNKT
jgi:hypothetical protein